MNDNTALFTKTVNLKTNDLRNPIGIDDYNPAFSWIIDSNVKGQKQLSYQIRVAKDSSFSKIIWDEKQSSDNTLYVKYAGEKLEASTKYYWCVTADCKDGNIIKSEIATFETGLMSESGFCGTEWISVVSTKAQKIEGLATFRKEFIVKTIKTAKLYSTALGVYDVYINGERVGHKQTDGSIIYDELKPGCSDNDKRVAYFSNDVTHMIKSNEANAISANVSSGWWSGGIGYSKRKSTNAFRAKLIITYTDGTCEIIGTDTSWKTSYCGNVLFAEIYNGEIYDSNADVSYRNVGFDDVSWHKAEINTEFKGVISAHIGEKICVRHDLEVKAKSVTIYDEIIGKTADKHGKINVVATQEGNKEFTLKAGQTAIVDMGQNFSGWDLINVSGAKGTKINMHHSEILNDNDGLISRGNDGAEGSIYTINLRSARTTAVYIMNGKGKETYNSTHTFYGYRFVEITATNDITVHSIVGQVVTSVAEDKGTISTSNKDINKLIANVKWGQYSNYLSIPTDCPQRDERQGWTADTQVFSTAAAYNADSKTFLEKWMQDMRDSQSEEGAFPDVAPGNFTGSGNFGWADAGVIVPYNLYKMYGDKKSIEDSYASMQKFMDVFMAKSNKNGAGHEFGDWLAYQETDKNTIGVAYYAWDAQLMAFMADVLGKTADAKKYNEVYKTEKEYFMELYINKDGSVKNPTQTTCLLALQIDLLPNKESREIVKKQLLNDIKKNGNRLQTGFLGTAVIMQTLSDIGASDVAYQLLLQHENPSWLYSVDQGATTIWERWNSYTIENGFGDPGMNSFNHYAYGAVSEWMFRYMAGIQYDLNNPAFKHIILEPIVSRSINDIDASFESVNGTIKSAWSLSGDTLTYNATVPANTTATLCLPAKNGTNVENNFNIKPTDCNETTAIFELEAGSCTFTSTVAL